MAQTTAIFKAEIRQFAETVLEILEMDKDLTNDRKAHLCTLAIQELNKWPGSDTQEENEQMVEIANKIRKAYRGTWTH